MSDQEKEKQREALQKELESLVDARYRHGVTSGREVRAAKNWREAFGFGTNRLSFFGSQPGILGALKEFGVWTAIGLVLTVVTHNPICLAICAAVGVVYPMAAMHSSTRYDDIITKQHRVMDKLKALDEGEVIPGPAKEPQISAPGFNVPNQGTGKSRNERT